MDRGEFVVCESVAALESLEEIGHSSHQIGCDIFGYGGGVDHSHVVERAADDRGENGDLAIDWKRRIQGLFGTSRTLRPRSNWRSRCSSSLAP